MSRSGSRASAIAIITRCAHAARELVRVLLEPVAPERDADEVEQLDARVARLRARHLVLAEDLGDLAADRHERG